jgi:F0F1-type ATP synthase membrane subunit b/b'
MNSLFFITLFALEIFIVQVLLILVWQRLKAKERHLEEKELQIKLHRKAELNKARKTAAEIKEQAFKEAEEIIKSADNFPRQWEEVLTAAAKDKTADLVQKLNEQAKEVSKKFKADYQKELQKLIRQLEKEITSLKKEKALAIDQAAQDLAKKVARKKLSLSINPSKHHQYVLKLLEEKLTVKEVDAD